MLTVTPKELNRHHPSDAAGGLFVGKLVSVFPEYRVMLADENLTAVDTVSSCQLTTEHLGTKVLVAFPQGTSRGIIVDTITETDGFGRPVLNTNGSVSWNCTNLTINAEERVVIKARRIELC